MACFSLLLFSGVCHLHEAILNEYGLSVEELDQQELVEDPEAVMALETEAVSGDLLPCLRGGSPHPRQKMPVAWLILMDLASLEWQ